MRTADSNLGRSRWTLALTLPQDVRGSASPKGEARRECAAKAERSNCRGREDYGWGWAGGVTKLTLDIILLEGDQPLATLG